MKKIFNEDKCKYRNLHVVHLILIPIAMKTFRYFIVHALFKQSFNNVCLKDR